MFLTRSLRQPRSISRAVHLWFMQKPAVYGCDLLKTTGRFDTMSQRPIDQSAKDPRRTAQPPPRFVRRKAHHPPDRAAGAAADDMRLRGNRMARPWPPSEKPLGERPDG